MFKIIDDYKIEYLDLSSSFSLQKSDILDFIARDSNLHTVDLSHTMLLDFQRPYSELPEKLGNLLLTNKTLKKLILKGIINLGIDPCIIDPIANGIANNDTIESLDLSDTSVIGFNHKERAQSFVDALMCNRSLTSLKLSEPSAGMAQREPDIYSAVVEKLNIIKAEVNSNCERDSVELARQLVNYNSPIQYTSTSAAAASTPLYKSISFLRHYGTSLPKLASLSHNLFKALYHINIPQDMISGLIPNIMSYAKDLFYSHHLFDILGITKNFASQEHKSNGAKDPLYSVLEFLTFDDIKYQQIEAPSTPALEEVSMAGDAASSDFEGKE